MWIYQTFGFGTLGFIGVVTSCIAVLFLYSSKSFAIQMESQGKKELKSE
jgi:hypothetical protein